jgi:cyclophilin family peptidyl-prolyl cis-trans isomerase
MSASSIALCLVAALLLAGCTSDKAGPVNCADLIKNADGTNAKHTKVAFETVKGTYKVELFDDASPITVKNFKTYVEEKYYDHVLYHRLIKGFMVQAGKFDNVTKKAKTPTHGAITLEGSSSGCKNVHYTLSMARTGDPNSAQTEFFTNFNDNAMLDPTGAGTGYAVFGIVYEGRAVVDAIEATPVHVFNSATDKTCQGEAPGGPPTPNCPNQPLEMISVRIPANTAAPSSPTSSSS